MSCINFPAAVGSREPQDEYTVLICQQFFSLAAFNSKTDQPFLYNPLSSRLFENVTEKAG
jgi:hypothetical protein